MSKAAGPYLSGKVLVAMPGIGDERFERAVIFLVAHDTDHAMGLTVNRPVDGLTVGNLLKRLGVLAGSNTPDDLVLFGGPVERERGFVVHTDDYRGEHSLEVGGGVALSATREVLEAMAGQTAPPRLSRLALGYAGWGAGQLENEIKQNVWLTCDPDEGLIFDDDFDHKWSRALAKLGVDPRRLSAVAGRA